MMAYVDAGYGVALIPAPDATIRGTNTLIRAVAGGRGVMKACAARLAVNNAPAVTSSLRSRATVANNKTTRD